MNFFHKESRSLAGGGGVEEVNFFNKESKTYLRKKKKIFFCVCEWGGGGGRGVDGLTDEQAQTNLPLQLLRSWGHNNALMYKLCP